MDLFIQSSWSGWIKPLLPPVLLNIYRRVRYRDSYLRPGARTMDVQFTLPSRALNELFPAIDSVLVTAPVSELYRPRDMVVPLAELLTLAAICRYKQPRRVFEIGTYTGSSTLVIAMNVPDQTEILTLDLEPSEIVGSAYRNTEHSSKIHQLYGNSLNFDYSPFLGSVDFILVDANHSYECVKSDTENAFRLLRPGGVIVWDDYRWLECHAECAGVTLFLNELQNTRSIFSVTGTRFAIYVDKPGPR
jgi:predicted O-methyltransferase YrrM